MASRYIVHLCIYVYIVKYVYTNTQLRRKIVLSSYFAIISWNITHFIEKEECKGDPYTHGLRIDLVARFECDCDQTGYSGPLFKLQNLPFRTYEI